MLTSPSNSPSGTVFCGSRISPLELKADSTPANAKNSSSAPAPAFSGEGQPAMARFEGSILPRPTITSRHSGISLMTVLNSKSLTPRWTPLMFTITRVPTRVMMNAALGTGSASTGNGIAIASTMAAAIAALERTFQPNHNNIDAMNPANGPNASSM